MAPILGYWSLRGVSVLSDYPAVLDDNLKIDLCYIVLYMF